jgi:hypothetical protein
MAHHTVRPDPEDWQAQVRYTDVACDACGTPLEPEMPTNPDGSWPCLQARHALHLSFAGGYGELIDVDGPAPQAALCERCACTLMSANPWLGRLLGPHLSPDVGHHCGERGLVFEPTVLCDADPSCRDGHTV